MTALAATVGNGNIAGVATAIAIGGPGAPLYMWLAGLCGMATKYAEGFLGVKFREIAPNGTMAGGPMYYAKMVLKIKPWDAGWERFSLFAALSPALSEPEIWPSPIP
jgi:Na+/alanine symporter